MIQLIANMTVIALPVISFDLNFTAETTLWINLIYLMSFVAFSLPFAKIISQYGTKKSMNISLIILFISILMTIFASDSYVFLIARLLQGLTSAAMAVCIYVIVVKEFSNEELGSALGIVASSGYVGMLIAPSFMGFMIYLFDWRITFSILIPILLIMLFLLSGIKYDWIGEKKPVNLTGSFLYIVFLKFNSIKI